VFPHEYKRALGEMAAKREAQAATEKAKAPVGNASVPAK
jgi:hypothetical protein